MKVVARSSRDSVFDKIAASAPVNRQAGMSSSRGEEFVSIKKLSQPIFEHQPPVLPAIPREYSRNPSFINWTGRQIGALRVIGVIDNPGKVADSGLQWVVRCACGAFEIRKSRALGREVARVQAGSAESSDRCQRCSRVAQMRTHGMRTAKGFIRPKPIAEFVSPPISGEQSQ